jgi:hypothetical protein
VVDGGGTAGAGPAGAAWPAGLAAVGGGALPCAATALAHRLAASAQLALHRRVIKVRLRTVKAPCGQTDERPAPPGMHRNDDE